MTIELTQHVSQQVICFCSLRCREFYYCVLYRQKFGSRIQVSTREFISFLSVAIQAVSPSISEILLQHSLALSFSLTTNCLALPLRAFTPLGLPLSFYLFVSPLFFHQYVYQSFSRACAIHTSTDLYLILLLFLTIQHQALPPMDTH